MAGLNEQERAILGQFEAAAKAHSVAWSTSNAHDMATAMEAGTLDCSPALADEILKVFWGRMEHVENWYIGDGPAVRQMRRILGIGG